MSKYELLLPAGDIEALTLAINNGADAVYIGMKDFSARSSANNFSKEDFIWAVKYAHLYDVKIYVAINTLIDDNRFDDAIKLVRFLYLNDVDAVIVQDLGLLEVISTTFVDLEIHASTQMFIHNKLGVKILKEHNVKRVVLARETPLHIIEECIKLDLDVEIFVYGALCTSYSGQCLMSSVLKNRSGNKGACAQLCRLPYTLLNEDLNETYNDSKYLLSLKDLNVIDDLPKLLDINVKSFKIEGRMKRSEYVGLVARTFKDAIVSYENNKEYKLSDKRLTELKKLYNREFTKGFIFDDYKLYNYYRPNHLGISIGKVVAKNNGFISIKTNVSINQFDGLRILSNNKDYGLIANMIYVNGLLVNKVEANEVFKLKADFNVSVNDQVLLTSDYVQLTNIQKTKDSFYQDLDINVKCYIEINKVIKLEINDNYRKLYIYGDSIVQSALKRPLTNEDIISKLKPLSIIGLNFNIEVIKNEDVFLPIKELNNLKRNMIDLVKSVREYRNYKTTIKPYNFNLLSIDELNYNIIEINDKDQIININNSLIVSSNTKIVDDKILYLPKLVNELGEENTSIIANSIGDINENTIITSHNFNIINIYAIYFLHKLNIKIVYLSLELKREEVIDIYNHFIEVFKFKPNIGIFKYGHRTLMNTKYCVISSCLNTNRNCGLCKKYQYYLVDDHHKFPLYMQNDCVMNILEETPFNMNKTIPGISNYYYRYTIE